ncbi:MAG TPA: amino acid permease [Chloroflexota bacterium]|nr:amino acid permease [Chloroflexota bacterium]
MTQRPSDATPRRHPRTLGWIGTTALAMGGSNQSLFLLGALVASQGSAAVPLLIVGLLLSYAAAFGWTELVLMFPDRVGGIAASCAEAFRPYSPVLSTLTGVCYWWGWVPTCGLTAILSASAITQWYLPNVPVPPLAVGLVLVFTLVNLAGVRWVTRLAIPIAFASAGLALVSGLAPVFAGTVDWQLASSFHLVSPFSGLFGDVTSAMAGLYLIGFAAPAFEAAACHVGETVDPERNVPRAMLASGAMAAVYFVLLPVIWLGVLGPETLQQDLAQILGPTFAPVFGSTARAAAIGFMMLNMFHGTLQPLAGASRTLMQLAEDGLLPRLLALRSRADVPWVATFLTALPAIAFLLAGDPTWLIAAANLAYLVGIGLPSVAVWLLRRDAPHLLRPYRAPRGTIELGLLAAAAWGLSCLLGFQQFGLPTVILGLMLCYSGAGLYALRRLFDRRRAGLPGLKASLHLKLTGAMLLVMALDGAGYLLAVDHVDREQVALVAALEDIFVAVALLTVSVGLVLPGMIAHAAEEVARAADHLATGTLADLVRAIQALGVGDLDAAHARVDVVPVRVHTGDELGAMAASFNIMQENVAAAALALAGAREGLRHARNDLEVRHTTLQANEENYRLALQAASMGTWNWDVLNDVHTWSVEAEALSGLAPGTYDGSFEAFRRSTHPDDWLDIELEERAAQAEHRDSLTIFRTVWPDGTVRWIESRGRTLYDADGTRVRVTGTSMDITDRKEAEEALLHQALHDGLTGLPNRTLLQDRVSQAILAAQRENAPLSLLLVDLDRFKEINDTFGHHYGDLLLQQIGPRLRGVLRAADTIARLGGDEFGILLPTTDAQNSFGVAQHLVEMLKAPFDLDGQMVEIDASIGIASYPTHGSDTATLLRLADVAMYVAKRAESGIVVYTEEQDHNSAEKLALGGELRRAIDNCELLLHFQPKLDMRAGTLVGVEALVRWQHPLRGFLPPDEFIPLAEQTGLIYPLTQWVLEAALRQHQTWREMGLDIPVAVNLSRRTLHDPRVPELVAQLLAQYAVPPSALILEITESSLMADPQRASENLTELRALGVRMSIDDFGTGYSSLDSLKDLSVDELKIDRSFVRAMATDARARAIVRAIIDLADALELRVVAEGVEDRATWDVLAGLGCDTAQGYFLCRPIAAAELEAWIADVSQSWLDVAEKSRAEDARQQRMHGRGSRLTAEEEFLARKRAEAALLASEERNRLALQATRMGTWDYDVIHDVQTWSAEMQALHGLEPGAFEGTYAAFKRAVHPEDWPAFEVEMQAAQAARRDSIGTYRSVWPDGAVRWLENQGRAIFAADGTLLRGTGTCLDITERKQAEEALRTSEERFRRQYKGFPLPTYSWLSVEDDFVLQEYNDAAEVNADLDVHHWFGRSASEMFVDRPQSLANLRECLNEQRTVRWERRDHDAATGQDRHLVLTYVFVPPQTVMVHREDLTELKRAEQQREAMAQTEKLRALGQMATGIAHNLDQSLMRVASYSDLARQALVQAAPDLVGLQDLLMTTTQAALDGGEMVKRLLLFTRAPSEHDGKQVDLCSVVRDAAQLTSPRWRDAAQAEGRHISLHVEAEGTPHIQGSPARLRELMTNLIFNAVDALPMGGTIRLRVEAQDGQGVIEVADSGLGMSAEVQARVFEPFFTTKAEGGTGLGLAMVFGIVEQHGGHIEVRSALGEGTTVHLTFPLVDACPDAESSMAATQFDPRPLRVLTVDDEPINTSAVDRMRTPSDHSVTVAGSREDALEKLVDV